MVVMNMIVHTSIIIIITVTVNVIVTAAADVAKGGFFGIVVVMMMMMTAALVEFVEGWKDCVRGYGEGDIVTVIGGGCGCGWVGS